MGDSLELHEAVVELMAEVECLVAEVKDIRLDQAEVREMIYRHGLHKPADAATPMTDEGARREMATLAERQEQALARIESALDEREAADR